MNTEVLATTAVKKRIAQTKYLDQDIPEGDRGVSWDGSIFAYSDKSKKKDFLIYEVPVQVKGRSKKSLKNDVIEFRMKRADLANYRNRGGTLLFVVYITPEGDEKIYYSALTPFSLNVILAEQMDNQEPKVTLVVLPDGADNLCRIVFTFIQEMKRQSTIKGDHNWTIEEIMQKFGPSNIEITFTLSGSECDRNDPFSFVKSGDFYIYADLKGTDISFPVQHIDRIETIGQNIKGSIEINDHVYNEDISLKHFRNGKNVISIGKGFDFIDDNGACSLKYHLSGNLNERIQQIKIMLDLITGKPMRLDGQDIIVIKPQESDMKSIDEEHLKSQLCWFELVHETLNKLHVQKPLEIENLSDKEKDNINMLVNAVLFGQTATFVEKQIPTVVTIDLSNLKLVLLFQRLEDNTYMVRDFFTADMKCSFDDEGQYPTSRFCILKYDDYLNSDNLYLQGVIDDFKNYQNEMHFERMPLCILELIKAYDKDENRTDLLDAAMDLCSWLQTVDSGNMVHDLNYLQCCLRKRPLTDEEKRTITSMITDGQVENRLKAGAYILLGDKDKAKIYIERLSEYERNEFCQYPIYRLLDHYDQYYKKTL